MKHVSLMAMLLVACGRDADNSGSRLSALGSKDTGREPSSLSREPRAESRELVPCRPTGSWAVCNVMDRLDRAGLAPRADSTVVREPPLTPNGAQVRVGNGLLQLYVYPDSRAREQEQRLLDKTKYVSFDAPLTMQTQPTLIYSANLLAILHSRNDHLRERVADAITAGPPQPPTSTNP
jgi:hypothetical protein